MKTWKNRAKKLLIIHNWNFLGSFVRTAHIAEMDFSILEIRLRHPLFFLLFAWGLELYQEAVCRKSKQEFCRWGKTSNPCLFLKLKIWVGSNCVFQESGFFGQFTPKVKNNYASSKWALYKDGNFSWLLIEFVVLNRLKLLTKCFCFIYLPYARHYNPRFVYFLPTFWRSKTFFQGFFFRKFCLCVWLVFKSGL